MTQVQEPPPAAVKSYDAERRRVRITALKALQLERHSQALIRVETDAGLVGYGEAGVTGPVARAILRNLERHVVGQDPLDIERLWTRMVGQQHAYMADIPTISGVDIALWDLAGKILNRPVWALMKGRFRETVPLYVNNGGPSDWTSKASCEEWAATIKGEAHGWHTIKMAFHFVQGHGLPQGRWFAGQLGQMLRPSELAVIGRGYLACREALGSEIDMIVHCHSEWDLPTALGLAEVLAPARPMWIEDPLPVPYSEAWKVLKQTSPVRICTGEKLELPRGFYPFLANGALDAIHPDLAFAGGLTGCWKIADLAELFNVPLVTHNVGSAIQTAATAHFGATVRNFVASETRIGRGAFVEEMTEEGLPVHHGALALPTGPGLGVTPLPDVLKAHLAEGEPFWE